MVRKLIYIEWEDVTSNDAWRNESIAESWASEGSWIVKQVGFVYKETKKELILVGGIHEEEEYQNSYHQMLRIPKSLIHKRINLTKHIK